MKRAIEKMTKDLAEEGYMASESKKLKPYFKEFSEEEKIIFERQKKKLLDELKL